MLDSGPLGLVSNPIASPANTQCGQWLQSHLRSGTNVVLPEIADYEVRRELIRSGKSLGTRQLDGLKGVLNYVPLTTETMLLAAQLWAEARPGGQPTADRHALDADVILASQAKMLASSIDQVVIATTNASHLTRFVAA